MLYQRIISAIIMIALVIASLFYVSIGLFALFWGIVCCLAMWEWNKLIQISCKRQRIINLIIVCGLMLGFWLLLCQGNNYVDLISIILSSITFIFYVLASILVLTYPKTKQLWSQQVIAKTVMGIFTLLALFTSFLQFYHQLNNSDYYLGSYLILYILILIWATDTGAFIFGKLFGKHKLAPAVSPGKTIEGLIGGVFSAELCCILLYYYLFNIFLPMILVVTVCVISCISVLGDLVESMLKREAKIKDSSNLIPGHGGVLDRIDSLLFAVPSFFLIYNFGNLSQCFGL